MLPHYLAKFRSPNFGTSGRKCKWKCNMHWFLSTHPILMHLANLLTCINFWVLLNIFFCKSQAILWKQVLWTEAAFFACLAWHWADHHWQWNWRVAWTYSHVCAGKRQTLRATIVTIFSHMTRDVSVFCQIWHDFYIVFENDHKFKLVTFAR